MPTTRIEISLKTIVYILLIISGIYVVSRIMDILVLLMISFVLMTALQPLVVKLMSLKFSRTLAIVMVYALLIGLLILGVAVIVPPLVDRTTKLFLQFEIPKIPLLRDLAHLKFTTEEVSSLINQYGTSVGTIVDFVTSTFSVLFSIFTILVMSLYLLLERDHLYRYSAFLFKTKNRDERGKRLFNSIEHALGSWVRGEFLLMVVIGVMTFVGLTLLGIPYAVPLAILAGLLEALPNLGPTIAAIPAIIVAALVVNPTMGLIVAVLYMVIQAIENNIVVPQVMKNAVGISPLTAIILILIGVRFGNVLGALLIVPFYIILRVVISEFSHEITGILKGKEE